MLSDIKKSILSGLLITIGGSIYLSCIAKGIAPLGAFLFAAGLFTICEYGYNLYTGKVGYIAFHFKDGKYIGLVALILAFNLLSTWLLGIVAGWTFPAVAEQAKKIYESKLELNLLKAFISAIFCGILMYLAVDTWKRGKIIGCFIYIPVFILCGFDHSIANSFYCGASLGFQAFTFDNFCFVSSVVLGNAVGGMTVPLLARSWKKNEEQNA